MDTGIHDNISNKDYHADKSYSSSLVKLMSTPAKAKHAIETPPEYKDCYRLGTAIHSYILEKELFDSQYFTGISAPRRGNDNISEWDGFFAKHNAFDITQLKAAEWYKEFEKQTGKSILVPDELQMIKDMAESVRNNPLALELLVGGKAEQSIYWTDKETGLNLRVRPDYLNHTISDLKSVKSAYAPFFAKSAYDLGYHISQVMYQDGVKQVTGESKEFKFICVEKTAPYLCAVHKLNKESEIYAEKQYRSNLRKLASCIELDHWQGYENNNELSLPYYAIKDK